MQVVGHRFLSLAVLLSQVGLFSANYTVGQRKLRVDLFGSVLP
jgi:hypothetical protein